MKFQRKESQMPIMASFQAPKRKTNLRVFDSRILAPLFACAFLFSCTTFTAVDPDKMSWSSDNKTSSSSSDSLSSSLLSSASSSSAEGLSYDTLTDTRYGDTISYKTVSINGQIWMAENLNLGTKVNGFSGDSNQTIDSIVEKFCYNDSISYCKTDGGLYQWAEAMALPSRCNASSCKDSIKAPHKGICPAGWHIPSVSDWDTLAVFLGKADSAGFKMKLGALNSSWNSTAYNDDNSSGFSARPAGLRLDYGDFSDRGATASFWVAAEADSLLATDRILYADDVKLVSADEAKTFGFSVRCLKDK